MPDAKSEILKNRDALFVKIGERLKEIRTQEKLNIGTIENELQFSKRTITRFELGEGGSTKSFISLINYYVELGYNMNWILLDNNSDVFKKEQSLAMTVDLGVGANLVEEAYENIKDLKKIFSKII